MKLVVSKLIAFIALTMACLVVAIPHQLALVSTESSYLNVLISFVVIGASGLYIGFEYSIVGVLFFSGITLLLTWRQVTYPIDVAFLANLAMFFFSLPLAIGLWAYKFRFKLKKVAEKNDQAQPKDTTQAISETLISSSIALVFVTSEGKLQTFNPAFEKMLGYRQEDLQVLTINEILNPRDSSRFHQLTGSLLHKTIDNIDTEIRLITKQGKDVLAHVTATILHNDSSPHMMVQLRDITKAQQLLEQLRHESQNNANTNLLNRQYFMALAKQEFVRSVRYGHSISLAVFEVDSFALIKEAYGDEMGNQVLSQIAEKASTALRKVDVVGHMKDEEFGIVFSETAIEEAFNVLERLQEKFLEIDLPDQQVIRQRVTVSVGLTTYSPNDLDVDDLISRAFMAMQKAKEEARNLIRIA